MDDKVRELERLIEGILTSYKEVVQENENLYKELSVAIEKINKLEQEKKEIQKLLQNNEEVINKLILRVKDLMKILEVSEDEKS